MSSALHLEDRPLPARADASAPPSRSEPRALVPYVVHLATPLVLLGLWALTLRGVELRAMTDRGLVSVLPWTTFAVLAVLTVSFVLALRDQPVRTSVAAVHVLVLVVALYGLTAFLEDTPRFSSVYRHAGIVDYISSNRSVDPSIDAYFNWPGFFVLGSWVSQAIGLDSALGLANWDSLAFNLFFVAPLLVIFRWASDDPRVHWLALWTFFSANWVGQDYLSPQALGFTLWLTILAAVLTTFTPRPTALTRPVGVRDAAGALRPTRVLARLRAERLAAGLRPAHPRAAGVLLVVVVIVAAVVTGHQLTPFVIVFGLAGLVLAGGLETRRLPAVAALLLVLWISYFTVEFLRGHIEDVSGPVGSTTQNLGQNVSGRVDGSPDHLFIVHLRLVGTAAIWCFALVGVLRRLRVGRVDAAFLVLGVTPFVLPVLQPYGGEMLLRVFLFTLPVVAFFLASVAFPTERAGRSRQVTFALALAGCVLLGAFQFMRYGNERMDWFTAGDAATVDALYREAPPGAQLLGGNMPWRAREYAGYEYGAITDLGTFRGARRPSPVAIAAEISRRATPEGIYVVITRSTRIEAELLKGKPGVLEGLARTLRTWPGSQQLHREPDGEIFLVRPAVQAQYAPG